MMMLDRHKQKVAAPIGQRFGILRRQIVRVHVTGHDLRLDAEELLVERDRAFEVLKRLQANPESREIPIVMLTAKAQDADVFRGWASGVSAYLTKPFNPLELITFVKRILSGYDQYDDGEKVFEV